MALKTQDDAIGYDYEWFGCDADGHVGLFTTAGGSYAPLGLLRDTDVHYEAARFLVGGPPARSNDIWSLAADRGMYGFDGDFSQGPYERKGVPTRPRALAELPPEVATVASQIRLRNLRFAELEVVTTDMLRQEELESG